MRPRDLLLALATLTGCRVDSLEGADYAGPKNECSAGCPSDATCVDNTCVAAQTNYDLVLEATPPTSAQYAPGLTFRVKFEDRRGGQRPIDLPAIARVAARLDAGTSLPLVLRLELDKSAPGMAASTYEARSLNNAVVPTTAPLAIPPGDYKVFVAPANDADLTTVPPVQLRNDATREPLVVTFPAGAHELHIAYGGTLRKLDVSLVDDEGAPLTSAAEARDISVIDLTTGKLASTIAHTCIEPGKPLRPEVTLVLAPELAGHRYSLRIESAETSCSAAALVARSTLDYDLQALDVEGRGNRVTLTMPRLVAEIARGKVTAFAKPTVPIEGKIVLRSVKLDETSDIVTGRLTSIVTETINGGFTVEAIPGTYRADIIPRADVRSPSSLYAICVDCTVPSQDPAAKPGTRTAEFRIAKDMRNPLSFEVPQRVQAKGAAVGFDGSLFTVGTWEAATSSSGYAYSPYGSPLLTRAQTANISEILNRETGARWNLEGALDPGLYDLIVRTPEASGYPWIVRPRFEVSPQAALDIGTMPAPAPVVVVGVVRDPSGRVVPRATIRARAFVTGSDPGKTAIGSVLVGETRADDNGNYRLVIPSTLTTLTKEKLPT